MLAHRLADNYECPACDATVAQSDATCPHCGFDLQANLVGKGVVDIVHTTSHDYFLELENGDDHLLVKRNTPLPYKTQTGFRLLHAEQVLAHFNFYNSVNDNRESIGELWLSFKIKEKPDKSNLPEVLLDFEIDVNNLITVSASLKNQPEVQLSRTLSRGKADERLFIELQQGIDRANQEEHDFYSVLDYQCRAVDIAKLINGIINPQTDEENSSLSKKAEQRLQVAREVLKDGNAPLTNQFYANDFLLEIGHLMPEKGRMQLTKQLEEFKKLNTTGNLQQILNGRKALLKEMDKYPILLVLTRITNALDICNDEDPAKVPRLNEYLQKIIAAIERDDADTANRLLGEILPEVNQIQRLEEGKGLHISHGVQK